MPVTRSATRASKQHRKANAVKNTIPKSNAKDTRPNTLHGTKEELPKCPRSLVEWISLKDSPSGGVPNSAHLFAILQEIQQLKGCSTIARGRPRELGDIEWLTIQWNSCADRDEFVVSDLSKRFQEALAPRSWTQEIVWPVREGKLLRAHPLFPPQKLYEVLTIYFPADLDETSVSSIEKFRGLPCWHIDGEDPVEYPSAALKSQLRAWVEGTCEYNGQAARRLLYLIKFVDEDGEKIYKENVKYNRHGRPPWDVMVSFFDDLEDLGMIGYDSVHVQFVEVVHYVRDKYEPEPPRPISPKTKDRWESLPKYDSDVLL